MARLLNGLIALVAMAAVLVAGPIGSGGVAAAAEGAGHESRLQQQVDRLPAAQRAELEAQLAEGIAATGTDLDDPVIRQRLARSLGVPTAEIDHAVESLRAGGDGAPPILMLFVAAALLFAPGVFEKIGGAIYELIAAGEIEGLQPF
jgi:hypothetical protein